MSVIYPKLIRPILFALPAETAHDLGIAALRLGLSSRLVRDFCAGRFANTEFGELKRFGLSFKNPLGIAAGFDKNGRAVNQLAALGFGFVEAGTVTFRPQEGNSKPRLFRLSADSALINRLGFNNEGAEKVCERLRSIRPGCVVGVNIGKNADVPIEAAIGNYLESFDAAFEAADYIAVNVSSPNTPDLRNLQRAKELEELLSALQTRNVERSANAPEGIAGKKPLLVKIAPDISEAEIEAIVDIASRLELSGIIATNTTISRDGLKSPAALLDKIGAGGLSGKPLERRSNEVISQIYKYSKGRLPVIGVGGIFTAQDAFAKIASGACLIQAYTGFVYNGVSFAREINRGLAAILRAKGIETLDEAIGINAFDKHDSRY